MTRWGPRSDGAKLCAAAYVSEKGSFGVCGHRTGVSSPTELPPAPRELADGLRPAREGGAAVAGEPRCPPLGDRTRRALVKNAAPRGGGRGHVAVTPRHAEFEKPWSACAHALA